MKFKDLNLDIQFDILFQKNSRLFALLDTVDAFTKLEMNKECTITSIHRTQEEQDALYKDVPLDKRPKRSPHQDWKAVDLRSSDFTEQEIKRIVDFCNQFKYQNGTRVTALYHTIAGNVNHLHIQYE